MNYTDIIKKVSEELNIPKEVVDKTYKAYWQSIRTHIQSLPLKEDISEEDFLKLRTNFNIPSIGKLYVTLDRFKRCKKRFEIIKNLKELNNK